MGAHTFLRTAKLDQIKQWMDIRGGLPARLSYAPDELRVKFGNEEPYFETIEWSKWKEVFEEKERAFLYEEPGFGYKVVARNGKEDGAGASTESAPAASAEE